MEQAKQNGKRDQFLEVLGGIGAIAICAFGVWIVFKVILPTEQTIIAWMNQTSVGSAVFHWVGERGITFARFVFSVLSVGYVALIVAMFGTAPKYAFGILAFTVAGLIGLLVVAAVTKWSWLMLFSGK